MTNLQLLLSIGIPTFVVALGILLNHREVTNLKVDMKERFDRTDARLDKIDMRLDRIDGDLRNFHGTDKELEGRINEISARIK